MLNKNIKLLDDAFSKPQYYFSDDEYIHWFECAECKCNRIVYKSNYCPKCGKKLMWADEDVSDLINKV